MRWQPCRHHHQFQNIAAATKPAAILSCQRFLYVLYQTTSSQTYNYLFRHQHQQQTMDPATGITAPHLTAKEKYTAAYNKTRDSKRDSELHLSPFFPMRTRCSLLITLGNMPNATKANMWRPESSSLHPTKDSGNDVSDNLNMQTHKRRGSFMNRAFGGFRGCAAR
jgi:hypothetical protein